MARTNRRSASMVSGTPIGVLCWGRFFLVLSFRSWGLSGRTPGTIPLPMSFLAPLDGRAPAPCIVGHRGACGHLPEHTAAAYRLAIAFGADAVEPDVVVSRDGVLVVRHEHELSGTTDVARRPEFVTRRRTQEVDGEPVTGWFVEDFTWAELATLRARERLAAVRPASARYDGRFGILRLIDLLRIVDVASERAGRAIALVVELKHASHFEALGLPLAERVAAELSGWHGRLMIESFEPGVLDELRHRNMGAELVFLLDATGAPADEQRRLGSAAAPYDTYLTGVGLHRLANRFHGISVPKSFLLPSANAAAPATDALNPGVAPLRGAELVDTAHAALLQVWSWTLRPENAFLAAPYRTGTPGTYGDWLGEWSAVYDTGVDGVFADHPDLAVAVRALRAETGLTPTASPMMPGVARRWA